MKGSRTLWVNLYMTGSLIELPSEGYHGIKHQRINWFIINIKIIHVEQPHDTFGTIPDPRCILKIKATRYIIYGEKHSLWGIYVHL